MFTGIVEHVGRVAVFREVPFGAELFLDPGAWRTQPAPGDSIAVNGCCLTVAAIDGASWRFDVIAQTLALTTLGGLRPEDTVNLEASATPTSLLGGHLVTGHVDGVGEVIGLTADEREWRLRIAAPEPVRPTLVERGSIAVDGVSLTLAAVEPEAAPTERPSPPRWFEVALIPTTLARTTLGALAVGDRVNLESDCIARMVAAMLRRGIAGGIERRSGCGAGPSK
ncbi:MAG TPA: riboflavin synthase [Phycisphaerales bacterium]|nr:riboflavin synthase [Phycisphaerales bacterium]HMP38320.1 riboflavin synthase [Phycisphaerales bacterium]